MKSIAIIASVPAVAAVIVCSWWLSQKPRNVKIETGQRDTTRREKTGSERNSFRDVLRDPDKMPDLNEYHRQIQEEAASLSGASAQIDALVDQYVFEADTSAETSRERRILAELGERAYPRALDILRDTSLKDRLAAVPNAEDSLPEAPISRLCQLFDQEEAPPAEAAGLLAPFLESESEEIRKSVALIIGSVGTAESIPELRRALTDEQEYVRSYALIGIKRAIEGRRIKRSAAGEFFELVAGMWPEDTSFNVCDSIPLILLRLDRERARTLLLGEELFTVRFPPVWRILQAFNTESVEVPRARLLALIDEAQQESIEYPMDAVLREALPLLGAFRNQQDLETLEHYLEHQNEYVSQGAIQGLYRFHQFHDTIRNPWQVVNSEGWDSLTTAEKYLCAIETLDAEVNNGGFSQYYFNSSGAHWRDALKGLAEIGADEHHRLMKETLARFPDAEPAVNRNQRQVQLSNIVRKQDGPFNEQDKGWYAIKDENLARLLFKFNLAHLKGRQKGNASESPQPQ